MLFNLNGYGLIKLCGKDTKKLLQGQLTCDVESICSMRGRLTAHCNPQGRIISLFQLLKIDEVYFLCMPRNMIAIALPALKKYAIFYHVVLTDESENLFCFATQSETNDIERPENCYTFQLSHHRFMFIGDKKLQQIIWNNLLQKIKNAACFATWKNLNLDSDLPEIHPETSGKFLPHELNLQHTDAISFNKGCFTGQEIIARMHYLGKIKKSIYRARITQKAALKPGAEIYSLDNGKACGVVVDSCLEKDNNYKALILLDAVHAINNHLVLDLKNKDTTFTLLTKA